MKRSKSSDSARNRKRTVHHVHNRQRSRPTGGGHNALPDSSESKATLQTKREREVNQYVNE
jgi:hypothetical protein